MKGRVLTIAGSDPGGGAGIQADIKTITSLGAYAMSAITSLTSQDTRNVYDISPVSLDFIKKQINPVIDDIGVDTIKTGMLYSGDIIKTVSDIIKQKTESIPIIVDPIMISGNGNSLIDGEFITSLKEHLMPKALITTPNIPEAEVLTGQSILSISDMEEAAYTISKNTGTKSVLIKGGHMNLKNQLTDILFHNNKIVKINSNYINTKHTHGTGCTYSAAISTFIAQGADLEHAVKKAHKYVHNAIKNSPKLGNGCGPLNHNVKIT